MAGVAGLTGVLCGGDAVDSVDVVDADGSFGACAGACCVSDAVIAFGMAGTACEVAAIGGIAPAFVSEG